MNLRIADLTPNSQAVYLYVRDNPGCTGGEICEFFRLSPTEFRDALTQLQDHGLLKRS